MKKREFDEDLIIEIIFSVLVPPLHELVEEVIVQKVIGPQPLSQNSPEKVNRDRITFKAGLSSTNCVLLITFSRRYVIKLLRRRSRKSRFSTQLKNKKSPFL